MSCNLKGGRGASVLLAGLALVPIAARGQNPAVVVSVDAAANLHPISPMVYGVAFAGKAQLLDLNLPLNRSGGNTMSTYNYLNNAANTAADYYFESIPQKIAAGFSGPGAALDGFISDAHAANAQPILTIPLLDWIAKINNPTGHPYNHSFSIAKYGAQQAFDPYETDAGNNKKASDGSPIIGNDPNDAYTPSTPAIQQGWISHLLSKWGNASGSGVRYYAMDNEPSLWRSTHIDVHPAAPSRDEVYNRIVAYSSAIKAVDPNAQVLGPEEWEYYALFRDGQEQANNNDANTASHGGLPYAPWLLKALHDHDLKTGVRSLDIFTTHYYPQSGEFSDAVDANTQALRNRSTRVLWDTNYKEESWMKYTSDGKPHLISLMKGWVSQYYPGLKVGLTEYNWGAESNIGGATAQADILGILGREGADFATRWTTPATGSPTYNSFKMYRNYDGNKSAFGETSIFTFAPNPDNVAAFGAIRASDAALTLLVISKYATGNTPVTLNLAHFATGGAAQAWQLTSANAITKLPDAALTGGNLSVTLPPQSVTLYVLPIATRAVSGNVLLEGIANAAPAQTVTFQFRATDGSGVSVTKTAAVLPSGAFALTGIPAKAYTLRVSGAKWLAQNAGVDATTGDVSGVGVTLPAGDANGDNRVDVLDFGALVNAYGSSASVSGSSYDATADFNCDGLVDVLDFGLLVNNYGAAGAL